MPRGIPNAASEEMSDPTPMEIPGAVETPVAIQGQNQTPQAASVARISVLDKMKTHFSKQKRVRVKVHNDSPVTVQVNGYTFVIQEGVPVEVPEQVAEILEDAGYI